MTKTKIEWADNVWNPVTGCTKVSEGCRHCYAERMAKRLAGRCGYPEAPDQFKVTLHPEKLEEPLHWKKPRRVFVDSMSDLFHEDVPDSFLPQIWAIMAICRNLHTFMILTKRPKRMMEIVNDNIFHEAVGESIEDVAMTIDPCISHFVDDFFENDGVLPNVWLGVSVEDQKTADERIPLLLQTPAALRFVSVEPMLGPVNLAGFDGKFYRPWLDTIAWKAALNWVICGCESGPGARPMKLSWAADLKHQCVFAGVPFFFKQTKIGKKLVKMPELDGKIWDELPG